MKLKSIFNYLIIGGAFSISTAIASEPPIKYPTQTVKIVIPYSPGGTTDLVARALAENLSKKWEKPVIIENKPGGGEAIAASLVASSKPDGYTLLLASDAAYVVNGLTRKDLQYNAATDLLPIIRLTEGIGVLVVNPKLEVKTVKDLMTLAQKKPGEVTYGSESIGSPSEFRMRIIGNATGGYKFNHIPYKGSAAVLADILGGRLDSAWLPPHLVKANLDSKLFIPIAVTGSQRNAMFPNIATLQEQGFTGADISFKMMVSAPKGTPQSIVNKIASDMAAVMKDESFEKKYIRDIGYTVIADTPVAFNAYLDSTRIQFAKLVKEAGLSPK